MQKVQLLSLTTLVNQILFMRHCAKCQLIKLFCNVGLGYQRYYFSKNQNKLRHFRVVLNFDIVTNLLVQVMTYLVQGALGIWKNNMLLLPRSRLRYPYSRQVVVFFFLYNPRYYRLVCMLSFLFLSFVSYLCGAAFVFACAALESRHRLTHRACLGAQLVFFFYCFV